MYMYVAYRYEIKGNGVVYARSTSKEIAEDQSGVHIMAMQ